MLICRHGVFSGTFEGADTARRTIDTNTSNTTESRSDQGRKEQTGR